MSHICRQLKLGSKMAGFERFLQALRNGCTGRRYGGTGGTIEGMRYVTKRTAHRLIHTHTNAHSYLFFVPFS